MNNRPNIHQYFLSMARLVSSRSTCARRSVGCVLVNRQNHVIATGYNGVPRGHPHCNEDEPCAGVGAVSGTNLSACNAIHAEQNALLQCHNVDEIYAAYVTNSPCIDCTKLLSNTSCELVVFDKPYAHDSVSKNLFLKTNLIASNNGSYLSNRVWLHYPITKL